MNRPTFRTLAIAVGAALAAAVLAGPAGAHHPTVVHLEPDRQIVQPAQAHQTPEAEFAAKFELALDEADAAFDRAIGISNPAHAGEFLLAHAGQLSRKDGCHKSKAEGRRHYHARDTAEAAGACIRNGGVAYRIPDPDPECESMLRWLEGSRANARGARISRDWFGDPKLTADDATELIRACRQRR